MALEVEKLKHLWDECNEKYGRVTVAEIARRLGTTRKIVENRITTEKLSPTPIEIACELEKDFPNFLTEYLLLIVEGHHQERKKYRQENIEKFVDSLDEEELRLMFECITKRCIEGIKQKKRKAFYED